MLPCFSAAMFVVLPQHILQSWLWRLSFPYNSEDRLRQPVRASYEIPMLFYAMDLSSVCSQSLVLHIQGVLFAAVPAVLGRPLPALSLILFNLRGILLHAVDSLRTLWTWQLA